MWKQIRFTMHEDDEPKGGFRGIGEFMTDKVEGTLIPIRIICGCCGFEFDPEEVEIIEIYKDWMDIQDAIDEPEPITVPATYPYMMPEVEKRAWFFCG